MQDRLIKVLDNEDAGCMGASMIENHGGIEHRLLVGEQSCMALERENTLTKGFT